MKFRYLLMTLCASWTLRGQEVTVPERPKDYVLDQTGKVSTEDRRTVVNALKPLAEQTGLGVYLVLLNSSAEEPPADVAKRLAQSWRDNPDTAVVLTAPDLSPPLLIELTGVALGSLKEEELNGMKAAALAEVGKAQPGIASMLTAAHSLGEQVRKFRTGAPLAAATGAAGEKDPTSHVSAWIAGGALVCCLVALVLMRRGRNHALIFPQTEPRHRFSAPHSGGNDAMVAFGKREN